MLKYIIKRLLLTIPLLWGIATATFFLVHLAPGDPMNMYLEPRGGREIDPEVIELILANLSVTADRSGICWSKQSRTPCNSPYSLFFWMPSVELAWASFRQSRKAAGWTKR